MGSNLSSCRLRASRAQLWRAWVGRCRQLGQVRIGTNIQFPTQLQSHCLQGNQNRRSSNSRSLIICLSANASASATPFALNSVSRNKKVSISAPFMALLCGQHQRSGSLTVGSGAIATVATVATAESLNGSRVAKVADVAVASSLKLPFLRRSARLMTKLPATPG